jgi:hypothetical protein
VTTWPTCFVCERAYTPWKRIMELFRCCICGVNHPAMTRLRSWYTFRRSSVWIHRQCRAMPDGCPLLELTELCENKCAS